MAILFSIVVSITCIVSIDCGCYRSGCDNDCSSNFSPPSACAALAATSGDELCIPPSSLLYSRYEPVANRPKPFHIRKATLSSGQTASNRACDTYLDYWESIYGHLIYYLALLGTLVQAPLLFTASLAFLGFACLFNYILVSLLLVC